MELNNMLININGFWCTIVGFLCMFIFALNLVNHHNDHLETLYSVGIGMMGIGLLQDLIEYSSSNSKALRIIFGILAVLSCAALFYTTLIVGKRTKWKGYRGDKNWWQREPAFEGIYAYCRHPSVWLWWIFLLSLVVCIGYPYMQAILFGVLGFVLAWYNDKNLYPVVTPGYDQYAQQVPFFFPRKPSHPVVITTEKKPRTTPKNKKGK